MTGWMDGGKVIVTDIFGPNTAAVELVIRRAAALTAEEIDKFNRLNEATGTDEKREHDREGASWYVSNAARLNDREEEFGGALQEAGDAAKAAVETAKKSMWSAAWSAALDAATAAVVTDLVGQHGLTQQHIDTLMGLWVAVLGSDWDKD